MKRKFALLTVLSVTACATQPPVTPATGVPCDLIEPVDFHYCDDTRADRWPDPKNVCDTPETVERVVILNAKLRAACP